MTAQSIGICKPPIPGRKALRANNSAIACLQQIVYISAIYKLAPIYALMATLE
jgi:hypothetical protein